VYELLYGVKAAPQSGMLQECHSRNSQLPLLTKKPSLNPLNPPLRVNARVSIPRDELHLKATRSGGPGGQHVNTSSTRIELKWNVDSSTALSDEDRARLHAKLGQRIDAEGWIRVTSSESRSQRRNREAAEERLAELIRRALVVPRPRRPSKTPRRATEARLESKQKRADRKKSRRWKGED